MTSNLQVCPLTHIAVKHQRRKRGLATCLDSGEEAGDSNIKPHRVSSSGRNQLSIHANFNFFVNRSTTTVSTGNKDGRKRRSKGKRKPVRQAGEETLSDLFKRLPLHKLVCIGCKRDDMLHDVTVYIYDRLKHDSDWRRAVALVGVSFDESLEARIAAALSAFEWDDFYDVEDPSDSGVDDV